MSTIKDCLLRARELGFSDTARLDVELLLACALKKNRTYLFTWPEKKVDPDALGVFEALFQRRLAGEPVAYLIGEQDFWSLTLKVSPATLIPRPETELLVELALDVLFDSARVLDLGTGTGAIALALASEFPNAQINAVDFNVQAVELAQLNAQFLGLQRVNIFHSHWFDGVQGYFDLIVTNPPYIEASDEHLTQGDVRFEPSSALVSGDDGLQDIRHIIRDAPKYLFEQGCLMIEHGWNQGPAVRQLLLAAGFEEVLTRQDLNGHDRVSSGRLP